MECWSDGVMECWSVEGAFRAHFCWELPRAKARAVLFSHFVAFANHALLPPYT